MLRRYKLLLPALALALVPLLHFLGIGNVFSTNSSSFRPVFHDLPTLTANVLELFREFPPVPRKLALAHKVPSSRDSQYETLRSALEMDFDDVAKMMEVHRTVVERLPRYSSRLFQGRGIVMVGGGRFLRIALLSIRLLRSTGTTLPLEFWFGDTDEYNSIFCSEVETLNVQCRILGSHLGAGTVGRYQLKAFAILLSRFEEVLFLDADDFPVVNVDDIFDAPNYKITGAVIWPDYWSATASPWLFQIIGQQQRFHATCETGQLMWNKKKHFLSLVLACYYNFYGPDYFYPLLSLGAAGEGDKETFLIACQVFDEPYTYIQRDVGTLGYHDKGDFYGTAMMQADPRNVSRYLFIHAHFPKLDGQSLFASGPMRSSNDNPIPSFWGNLAKENAGYDVEVKAFQEMAYIECTSPLRNENDPAVCKRIHKHLQEVAVKKGYVRKGRKGPVTLLVGG
jgi:alpha 1,2-mannosyltransferase